MKIYNKFIAIALSALAVTACSDDLNTVPEGGTMTEGQKDYIYGQDPEKLQADVLGLYSSMIEYAAIAEWYGATRHYDFGYAAVMLMMDSMGQDMPSEDSGYNWFDSSLTMTDRTKTSDVAYFIWNHFYKQMGIANRIIAAVSPDEEDPTARAYRGQALAIRAFDYLNLVQLYQFTYKGHENEPGVPIVPETMTGEEATDNPRATVAQVYEQILSDLKEAIALLPETGANGQVNRKVAYGLRARANLVMQNYEEAYNDAVEAAKGYSPYSIAEVSQPSFNAYTHSWIWGNVVTETNDIVLSGLLNFPSHMCSFTGNGYSPAYAGRYINDQLYAQIPETDVRKGWWAQGEMVEYAPGQFNCEFYYDIENPCPNVDWTWSTTYNGKAYNAAEWFGWQAPLVNVKFGAYQNIYDNATNACDIPLMRVEEMILIQAEAKAMSASGSVQDGKNILEPFVRAYRDPSYVCEASSKEEFLDAVWLQRRVELWGEGHSWFDIMRLKKPVMRIGTNYETTVAWNLKAESPIFLMIIPEAETNVNPACKNNTTVDAPQAGQTF